MRNGRLMLIAALGLVVFATACEDDVTNPLAGFSGDEFADVALESDLVTEEILNDELDSMGAVLAATTNDEVPPPPLTDERMFSKTRSCPAGGEMSVSGTITRTFDQESGVMEADSTGTRSRTDCIFAVRGNRSITINATANWEIARRRIGDEPDGLQTSHFFGSANIVRSDGMERSCEFDYTVTRDRENQTRTIDGTMCGDRVRRGVGWANFRN